MRRAILIPILVFLLGLAMVAGAEATLYRGVGKGIRVAFQVKGQRVVSASVYARLYCARPDGGRHFGRVKKDYASFRSPLRIDQQGRFRWVSKGRQEEGYAEREALYGRVSSGVVTGRFEYFTSIATAHRDVVCRAGSYPLKPGETEVPFRAPRQTGGS